MGSHQAPSGAETVTEEVSKASSPAPRSPKPVSSILIMEPREGRIGNAFACERCRKHKVRCVPSDQSGICQRCQKARVECVEHVARRRPAKSRSDGGQPPTKIREYDKKLDKLDKLSAIVANMATTSPPLSLPSVATLPSHSSTESQIAPTPTASHAPSMAAPAVAPISKPPILPSPASKSETSLPFWDSMNETVSCLGRLDPIIRSISVMHMQMLLDVYRAMVDFFPFVVLPKQSFGQDLLQTRPMLMFAVLTAASSDSALLQLTLSREFRKVVMVKIMNGEKNLDLLQGLLVFIASHHHYMDSQAVSVPMLLQLCVGIAHDLGLDNLSSSVKSPLHKDDPKVREGKRAYLGCYYLVSTIAAMEPGKVRPMTYSNTLRTYAADLAASWENPSDTVLPILTDVCQFMEDVEGTFQAPTEQALVLRSQVKRLTDKWEAIHHASKAQAANFKTLQWLQLAARVHLHKTAASVELSDRESTPWASGFQLSVRVSCLRSIEQFLDNSTKLPSNQFEYLSIVDWLNLVTITTGLGKLVLHSTPIPGWDPTELQIVKTFEYFRDTLASTMPRPRDAQDSTEDCFERFRRISATMRTALRNHPGRGSPTGTAFELATGSGRRVSLLQDLPLPKLNGAVNGNGERLPSLVKINPMLDLHSNEFHWNFLNGTA